MFHFLEYPFSRGFTHVKSADPYEAPDFDTGFMNDERDMVPMVWGYIKSRETARRMDAYAGEVQNMVGVFRPSSRQVELNIIISIHSLIMTLPLVPTTWTSPQPRPTPSLEILAPVLRMGAGLLIFRSQTKCPLRISSARTRSLCVRT